MTFGEYLRQAMTTAGFPTAAALARASGASESAISKWRNDVEPPRIPALRQIAPALNIPLLELMAAAKLITPEEAGLDGEPTPPEPLDVEELMTKESLTPEEKEAVAAEIRRLRAMHTTPKGPKRQGTDDIEARRPA